MALLLCLSMTVTFAGEGNDGHEQEHDGNDNKDKDHKGTSAPFDAGIVALAAAGGALIVFKAYDNKRRKRVIA